VDTGTEDEGTGRPERAAEAFFGRRKTKPLRKAQQALYDELLPRLRLDLTQPCPADIGELFPHKPSQVRLEIGFGAGEHLAHEAARFPAAGFIGAEVFLNGVVRMLQHIDAAELANVRIHDEDALPLLEWLPDASIDRIDLLYPDPWPKKRHHKRRIVQPAFMSLVASRLRVGGVLRMATDWQHYATQMLEVASACPLLANESAAGEYVPRPDSRPVTRFERRGQRLGHGTWDLSFRRS